MEIFTNLEQLTVSYEELAWLPDISGFPLLTWLDVGHNVLMSLPDWTTLTNLVHLDCSYIDSTVPLN